jgi:hypothetical protein
VLLASHISVSVLSGAGGLELISYRVSGASFWILLDTASCAACIHKQSEALAGCSNLQLWARLKDSTATLMGHGRSGCEFWQNLDWQSAVYNGSEPSYLLSGQRFKRYGPSDHRARQGASRLWNADLRSTYSRDGASRRDRCAEDGCAGTCSRDGVSGD